MKKILLGGLLMSPWVIVLSVFVVSTFKSWSVVLEVLMYVSLSIGISLCAIAGLAMLLEGVSDWNENK